ncbi:hypothetical protein NE237_027028 [Protea cynaroides]|uniref:BHLH domain-containing protein n=1 Tax=Protea cynaroides TaxID=273540 RepID=A0A9Q0GLS6_9MAGN|nr:hypothetical protein NE237_027028 [Protea cynaroides]
MRGGGRRDSSSHSHVGMEDKWKLSSVSFDNISNNYNQSDYGSAAASMEYDLQEHLGFDLKHDCETHFMLEILHDPNPTPLPSPMDQPNWDVVGIQEMQDMNCNPLQLQQPQQMGLQQNLQSFDATSFATPGLLDLLHLPGCSVSSMLPTATDINNLVSSSTLFDNPPLHLDLPPQPPLKLFHSVPHSYGGSSLFGGINEREGSGRLYEDGDGRQFENSVLDFRIDMNAGLGKGGDARGTHHFVTEKQRREQFTEKYKALGSLIPNPRKRDKASVVGDAIEYIRELLRTVQELKLLIDQKKCMQERKKRLKI